MRRFLDTSVVVAAFLQSHPQHLPSLQIMSLCRPEATFCSVHTFAEIYATFSALPLRPRLSTAHVLSIIEELTERVTAVELGTADYREVIRDLSQRDLRSGIIYDALLMRCAIKSESDVVVTWNVRHFRAVAPAAESRVATPQELLDSGLAR